MVLSPVDLGGSGKKNTKTTSTRGGSTGSTPTINNPTPNGGWDALFDRARDLSAMFNRGSGGSGGGRGPFDDLQYQLKDLNLNRQALSLQRDSGLRDIETARLDGLRAAVNNSLERGIFRSGVTNQNKDRVNARAGEATNDLRERIRISMEMLDNDEARMRAYAAWQKSGGGGGGRGGGSFNSFMEDLFLSLLLGDAEWKAQNPQPKGPTGRGGSNNILNWATV